MVVAHTFNTSTWEAERGKQLSVSSRPALSTEVVPRQLVLHKETLSQEEEGEGKEDKVEEERAGEIA